MRVLILAGLLAVISGCSIMGYRQVGDLKSNAKGFVDVQLRKEAVLVYRDAIRAIESCHSNSPLRIYRSVAERLNREDNTAVISVMHQGRYIARYELVGTADANTNVKGWWLPALAVCLPDFSSRSVGGLGE